MEITRRIASVIMLALVLLTAMPAHAATVIVTATTTTVILSSSHITNQVVRQGAASKFSFNLVNTGTTTQLVRVSAELANNEQTDPIALVNWDNQSFSPGQALPYNWAVPTAQQPNLYRLRVRIYPAGGGPLLNGYDHVQPLTVLLADGVSLHSVTLDHPEITPGGNAMLRAVFMNTSTLTKTVLLDIELKSSSGELVAQSFQDNISLGPNKTTLPLDLRIPRDLKVSSLAPGEYVFKIGVFRPLWNGPPSPWYNMVRTFVVKDGADMVAPSAAFVCPNKVVASAFYTRWNFKICGTVADLQSGVDRVDVRVWSYDRGNPWRTYRAVLGANGAWTVNGLQGDFPEGKYRVKLHTWDKAGNPRALDLLTPLIIDNTSPNLLWGNPTSGALVPAAFQISGNVDDANGPAWVKVYFRQGGVLKATFNATMVGSFWAKYWSVFGKNLASGTYDVQVVASDWAGNTATSQSRTLTVDADMPGVHVDSPTDGSTVGSMFNVSGTASGATSVWIDIMPQGSTTVLVSYTATCDPPSCATWTALVMDPLPSGTYEVRATAQDTAGNQSSHSVYNLLVP